MAVRYNSGIVTRNLLLNLDFANPANYVGSGSSATSLISPHTFSKVNASYSSYSNGVISFTRLAGAATQAAKQTAGDQFWTTITTTALKPPTFLYNDFTWEVWYKPNDFSPSSYDATEYMSAICVLRGWHQGFTYDATNVNFWILSNTGPTFSNFLLPHSGNITLGQWHQLAVTRSGTTYTFYVNGTSRVTGTYTPVAIAEGVYTSNDLCIGGAKYTAGTADYCWWPKMDVSNVKMYNMALSATEIKQNFNALRGRFGI